MSVAEKMRALDADERDEPGERLWLALPQIVAVVEAAEADASLHQFPADLASCPNPLCVALAALDEALR